MNLQLLQFMQYFSTLSWTQQARVVQHLQWVMIRQHWLGITLLTALLTTVAVGGGMYVCGRGCRKKMYG